MTFGFPKALACIIFGQNYKVAPRFLEKTNFTVKEKSNERKRIETGMFEANGDGRGCVFKYDR